MYVCVRERAKVVETEKVTDKKWGKERERERESERGTQRERERGESCPQE